MLAQTDIERESCEARRKGLLDYTTDMRVERRIGRAVGTVQLLQRILKQPVTTDETLGAMTTAELEELEATLTAAGREAGIDL